MRFPGSRCALIGFLFAFLLPLLSPLTLAQRVTYYDFDSPQATASQVSRACSANIAPGGALFCFNDGTGQNASPSLISDTYPAIIDPVATDDPAAQSTHYALQLTPSQPNQASSVWFSVPQKILNGFTTYFAFKITPDPTSFVTADGFAFVIQNSVGGGARGYGGGGCIAMGAGLGIVGGNGGCLGYGGIDNSLALEFDTYRNQWDPSDNGNANNDNHIALQNCGPGLANSPDHVLSGIRASICEAGLGEPNNGGEYALIDPPGITLADGNVHQVVIEYSGANSSTPYILQIYIDPVFVPGTHTPAADSIPLLSGVYPIQENTNLMNSGSVNDSAYVGFTAGTGGGFEQHEILAWTFTPHDTVTQTQPLNPTGTPTTFPFGSHSYTVTYEPDGPSTDGIDMMVTASTISPAFFSQLVAGSTQFFGVPCQVYDDTGGNCIVYSVSCVNAATNAITQCPVGSSSEPIQVKTAFDNSTQPIAPGLYQGDPFYRQISSIVGNGQFATVTCVADCAATNDVNLPIAIYGNSTPGFNGSIVVNSTNPDTLNTFPFASAVTGTGSGGLLTSTLLHDDFFSYQTQRIDGTIIGYTNHLSDFIAVSNTPVTTLTLSPATLPYTGSSAGPLTITATSGRGTPTGSVTVIVDGDYIQPQVLPLSSTGTASFYENPPPGPGGVGGIEVGAHSVTMTYPATGIFTAATATGSFTVTPIAPTLTVSGGPTTAAYNKSTFLVSATTNSASAPEFSSQGPCTVSSYFSFPYEEGSYYIVGYYSQDLVTITGSSGTCTLTATVEASRDYIAAAPMTVSFPVVGAASTTTVITDTPNPANLKMPVTLGFSVTGSNGTPTGKYTVTSSVTGDPSCAASLTAAGTGACVLSFATPGTRILTISYGGNANFGPSSTTVQQSVASVPLASVWPASINFGTLTQGTLAGRVVVLTNNGSSPMTVTNPALSALNNANPTNFSAINQCPTTLAPGESCAFYITLVAGAPGSNSTANLQIISNAANTLPSVPLSATFLDPQLTFAPSPVAFGTQSVGTTIPISVTLTNNGPGPETPTNIQISGADAGQFSQTSNCLTTLATGASCTITVSFMPAQAGAAAAYLRVSDLAGPGFQQVMLSGTAQ